ncbi:GntR family transcriptional regulator (plasmid) [Actinomadura graeca]|uniref:GntR family transcriptional regulator n=1 Tax=Actinomadura graeca TaxID=2750812 RepID=A0ABX8R7K2_9ACTN|nr:GntR family transcriptional regulator [Actinomadura graeca]QXJ27066.1 GntR family transcriptional regulator [Actinomadura graeca]
MTDITDGRSRQTRIADDLRAKIRTGVLQPGERLPGLPDLVTGYGIDMPGVSMNTVRLAIAKLRQEGLIISKQGKGNFVRTELPVRRHGIERYSRSVWGGKEPKALLEAEGGRQGRSVRQDTETAIVPAPAFVAKRLDGVSEGDPVHVRRRVTRLDGVINQAADSYFTLATGERSPAVVAGEGQGGHIARINAISPVLEVEEEITARMPTGPESSRLDIPEGTPVLDVIRTYHTEIGALDITKFVIRADMAVFNYRFPIPD